MAVSKWWDDKKPPDLGARWGPGCVVCVWVLQCKVWAFGGVNQVAASTVFPCFGAIFHRKHQRKAVQTMLKTLGICVPFHQILASPPIGMDSQNWIKIEQKLNQNWIKIASKLKKNWIKIALKIPGPPMSWISSVGFWCFLFNFYSIFLQYFQRFGRCSKPWKFSTSSERNCQGWKSAECSAVFTHGVCSSVVLEVVAKVSAGPCFVMFRVITMEIVQQMARIGSISGGLPMQLPKFRASVGVSHFSHWWLGFVQFFFNFCAISSSKSIAGDQL